MPARTNAFQRLVTLLSAALAGHAKVTESAMLRDRITGKEREVDVLILLTGASYEVKLAIEVISWRRFADTPWVEKMRAKHENLPIDKLVLVSEKGFSVPAKQKAEFYGIECLTIEEACAVDWPTIGTLVDTGNFEVISLSFAVSAICNFDDGRQQQVEIPIGMSVGTPSGSITIDSFVRSLLDRPDLRDVVIAELQGDIQHEFWLQYVEPAGLFKFDQDGESCQATELRIGLSAKRQTTPIDIKTGIFRSTPFISGTSVDPLNPLEFVLLKNADAASSGYLVDATGVRTLQSLLRKPDAS